ncbi:MAG: PilZ domain-containing protein [Proteobacteria bacterium]|nr:PilZ domain-containing protein [Pseudomonadota bacterium]
MNKDQTNKHHPSTKQLIDCLHMLTLSLAQHRKKNTEVPLMDALSIVMGDGNKSENQPIIDQANDIYHETLTLVETYLHPVVDATNLQEHRSQPRLNVSSLITIKSPSTDKEWRGNLSNISWGGVRIRTKESLGDDGDLLNLLLPYSDGGDIEILSTIIRSWEFAGMYNTSVRFTVLHQKDESRLDDLLEILLDSKDEKNRQYPRFAHRIDVTFWDLEELKSTLEDISKGGMKIVMPDPVKLNESIQIQLDGTDEGYSLNLRARVIRQTTIDISDTIMYQMALKFEHPTDELHSMVQTLMQNIMKKSKDREELNKRLF